MLYVTVSHLWSTENPDHDQSVLVPFFLFLTEVCCKKVENGTVENELGPKGHKEDNLRLQVYLTSK